VQVYAPVNWQGYGKPVQAPARFNAMYEAQSLTMAYVTWHGWGTRFAIGHGLSFYNSNRHGENVTLYMGGGFTICPNGKRYYRALAAVGYVTTYFPVEPLNPWFGEKATARKGLLWHLKCTGGPLATTGYWSRLR
jgi:hypothetical protein